MPIGQLDGGHVMYALMGEKHHMIAKLMIPVLVVLGIVFWAGWLVWAAFMIIIGYKHPPVVYPEIQLDGKRKFLGWMCLVIFILTFTPVPIQGF